jgi:alkylation response protein AidB-like acyl-CoA dehydrogenase
MSAPQAVRPADRQVPVGGQSGSGYEVRLEACRPLVYNIGWLKERNRPAMMEASIAKLFVSESLVNSCMDALQIYGGYGYMVEQGIERELRDALDSKLYSGTSEIQRNVIAKCLGF